MTRRRRLRARGRAAVVLAAAALAALLLVYARQWNPVLSHDTAQYFYPSVAQEEAGFEAGHVLSAFRVPPDASPDTHQVKPVFVAALRAWHGAASLVVPAALPFPSHKVYSDFITFTYVSAFLVCGLGGARAGRPLLVLTAAVMTFFSPWLIVASYFNSYTALSLLLLCASVFLLLSPRPRPGWAGVLCVMNMQTNQSTLVFTAAMVVLLAYRSGGFSGFVRKGLWFAGGLAGAWSCVDLSLLLVNVLGRDDSLLQGQVLWRYLGRSRTELRELFDVYDGTLLPLMFWQHSPVLTIAAAGVVAATVLAAATGRGRRLGPRFVLLVLYLAVAALLIDVRHGPKFSRTYVLMLPFVTLVVVAGVYWLVARAGRWRRVAAVAAIVAGLAYTSENVRGSIDLHRAFLSVRHAFETSAPGSERVWVAGQDTYLLFFRQLVDDLPPERRRLEVFDEICTLVDGSDGQPRLIAVGPNVSSVLNLGLARTDRVDLPLLPLSQAEDPPAGTCPSGREWHARLDRTLPFFAHHPWLVLEDPVQTYNVRRAGHYTSTAYKEVYGEVTFWRLSARP